MQQEVRDGAGEGRAGQRLEVSGAAPLLSGDRMADVDHGGVQERGVDRDAPLPAGDLVERGVAVAHHLQRQPLVDLAGGGSRVGVSSALGNQAGYCVAPGPVSHGAAAVVPHQVSMSQGCTVVVVRRVPRSRSRSARAARACG